VPLYTLFAEILDYPGPGISLQLKDVFSGLAAEHPEVAELIAKFQAEQARMSLDQLQELYTTTFDMRPDCTPNLGYHLFGDDVRRNVFMAQLKGRMESHHVAMGSELPDHISLILRLLDKEESEDEKQALVEDCLIPAISRILEVLDQSGTPVCYGNALRALLLLLRKQSGVEAGPVEALRAPTT
jgi:nitrate reductase molybdenum cofactor assembly chaperone NarJ/NarW